MLNQSLNLVTTSNSLPFLVQWMAPVNNNNSSSSCSIRTQAAPHSPSCHSCLVPVTSWAWASPCSTPAPWCRTWCEVWWSTSNNNNSTSIRFNINNNINSITSSSREAAVTACTPTTAAVWTLVDHWVLVTCWARGTATTAERLRTTLHPPVSCPHYLVEPLLQTLLTLQG